MDGAARQRKVYGKHQQDKSEITAEHIKKLDSLEFVWEVTPVHKDDLLQKKLAELFEENGNWNAPTALLLPMVSNWELPCAIAKSTRRQQIHIDNDGRAGQEI